MEFLLPKYGKIQKNIIFLVIKLPKYGNNFNGRYDFKW